MIRDRKAHPRVLLIEDDDMEREIFSTVLARRKCQVYTSPDAEAAIDYFRKNPDFDLVITDLHLEGMTGAAATAKLKWINPEVAVLVITGDCESKMADKALEAGAMKVLCKPFTVPELLAIIESVVNPPGQ
jgi:CheY-like chemotaxis protein